MTSAVKHEACANLAIDAFDSVVYSQAHAFSPSPSGLQLSSDRKLIVPVREEWV
jgi:hypothetical protein